MSRKTAAEPPAASRVAQSQPTPRRAVISVALVLFVPALWLVMDGNLAVQTALFRFIGALLVSWVAARLVLATVSSYARSAGPASTTAPTMAPGPAHLAAPPGSSSSTHSTQTTDLGLANEAGRPGNSG